MQCKYKDDHNVASDTHWPQMQTGDYILYMLSDNVFVG